MENLKTERTNLAEIAFELYNPENFPGSTAWRKWNDAEKALEAFDAAHPEIIAEIKAARKAKDAATAERVGWI